MKLGGLTSRVGILIGQVVKQCSHVKDNRLPSIDVYTLDTVLTLVTFTFPANATMETRTH